MTRINVVPVEELCDQHLLAEHRELTRIPNGVVSGKYRKFDNIPETYRLGAGHVMQFLNERYTALHAECLARGFNVTYKFPAEVLSIPGIVSDYVPTAEAFIANRARIAERMPAKARFTRKGADQCL
jgi:deoxyribonuclease (pyrimidine dimer)